MAFPKKTTTEIEFDEGDVAQNKSPYELTKRQIWYKAFQRCFDEGSKQMDYYYTREGLLINQYEVFINSVNMFHIMALGTLILPRYKDLMVRLEKVEEKILEEEKNNNDLIKGLIETAKINPKIDIDRSRKLIDLQFKKNLLAQYRQKLAILSTLMEKENYLDGQGGIVD